MSESPDSVHVGLHMEVNIRRAKTHLSRLLQLVADGEEIIITRAGVPAARLVAVEPKEGICPLGFARDQVWIADDFDVPLPDDLLAAFYGGTLPKLAKTRRRKRK